MKFQLATPLCIHEIGQRANQEDSIFPVAGKATSADRLFIVCDGMGGHENGEVASKTICESLAEYVGQHFDDDTVFTTEMFNEAIDYAYQQLDKKDNHKAGRKMGTTLTFILFHKGGCMMAHIGDSRIYHVRTDGKKIEYMSKDHSLVFDLFRSGEIEFDDMREHPRKNIITRAMMPGEDNRVEAEMVNTTDIHPGDYFYLCSDGMVEQMDEADIVGILTSDNTDEVKLQRLMAATSENKDNHSAYIIRVDGVEADEDTTSYVNDEKASRSNVINYVPELNSKEATKVRVGEFSPENAEEHHKGRRFPWVKIVAFLIVAAAIGLFWLPGYLCDHREVRVEKAKHYDEDSIREDIDNPEEQIYQSATDSLMEANRAKIVKETETPKTQEQKPTTQATAPKPQTTTTQAPANNTPAPQKPAVTTAPSTPPTTPATNPEPAAKEPEPKATTPVEPATTQPQPVKEVQSTPKTEPTTMDEDFN